MLALSYVYSTLSLFPRSALFESADISSSYEFWIDETWESALFEKFLDTIWESIWALASSLAGLAT